ncbi:MAG TPA: ABC transporter permease, partial [Acidobacteriota bacterium]|nr:ABC transporter permease [Acidobacteriota bacterium]
MLIPDIFKLSTRMFKSRRMRTALTVLGIGIGIGAILFLVSLGYGLQRALISQITSSDSLLSLDVVQGEKSAIVLDNKALETIAVFPEVQEVAPLVSLRGQITYDGITADMVANVTSPSFIKFSNMKLVDGVVYNSDKNEVIISKAVATIFNITDLKEIIGKEIGVSFLAVKAGEAGDQLELVEQPGTYVITGVVGDDSSPFVFFPITQVKDIALDVYSQAKVRVHTTAELDTARNKILDLGFVVASLSDVIDQANKIFGILQIILAIFGIVALVVSAIGMFNTMTIALMERTQEVG